MALPELHDIFFAVTGREFPIIDLTPLAKATHAEVIVEGMPG